jgi:ribosomal-protein-alanine N-acetyltransferase
VIASEVVATVREMRWWDIEAVMALEVELFGDEAWSPTMFWSELAEHSTRHYVVATAEDRVVAYAGLCVYPPHESYVQTIGVTRVAQGQGLGTRLLVDLIEESQRRSCKRLDLEVRADNDIAIALYERHGFERIGLRRGYYQPSGTDAVVMRRLSS